MVWRVFRTMSARVPCHTSALFAIMSYWIPISECHKRYGNAIGGTWSGAPASDTLFFKLLQRQQYVRQRVPLDAHFGVLLNDSGSRHEPCLLACFNFPEWRLDGPGSRQVNTLIVARWHVDIRRAYHRVAELYGGVLGLPVPESSRPQSRADTLLLRLHDDFLPILLFSLADQQSFRRDAFPLEQPWLSVDPAFDAGIRTPPDRLHTRHLRNDARVDNIALGQARKILTEMHTLTILLVQVIRPARLQSERIIERAALRLRPYPRVA